MRHIQDFVDNRNKTWCIHCGRYISQIKTNRDHVPSKALLDKPYPANLPVIEICTQCNESFSTDEEYTAAFISAALAGSAEPEQQSSSTARSILATNKRLRSDIERSRETYTTCVGEIRTIWRPDIQRIRRIMLKNARGHAYFELGEPMLDAPEAVWCIPASRLSTSERSRFETIEMSAILPELGCRLMARILDGDFSRDAWIVVQNGIYRYAVSYADGVRVRMFLSEYLAAEVYWEN